ncbi:MULTISPECIES: S26 family signal peptidase [Salinibaculum]|uniref:S26 family signal peptidase n=1 Tax=Salinibaculum TaxID=2732368 RepID=UPI0030D540B6
MSSPGDDDRRERSDAAPSEDATPPRDDARTPADGPERSVGDAAVDRESTSGPERPPSPEEWRTEETGGDAPPRQRGRREERSEARLFVYDLVSSVLAVLVVGAYLFAVSGVWPPLVAVESRSMVPNMQVNDLVFVMEEHRFPGEAAQPGTGVVTAHAASDGSYVKFGQPGDVIVFEPDGNERTTPIIHRAMYWVDAGENWCAMGDDSHLRGLDPGDEQCTADHGGFITKGDNNAVYDQATSRSGPVRPEWVIGTAEFRVPGLGWVRLSTQ